MSAESLRSFDNVADRIKQHRQASQAPILLVEGSDDFLVLREHVPAADIFPADGKKNVIAAAR